MSLTLNATSSEGREFAECPEGIFNACVIEVKTKNKEGQDMLSSFKQPDGSQNRRCALVFQTEAEVMGEAGPCGWHTVWDFHNIPHNVGNEKSTLHQRIIQIAGKGSIKTGNVNVDELIVGKPVKVTVTHGESGKAKIVSVRQLKDSELAGAWTPKTSEDGKAEF